VSGVAVFVVQGVGGKEMTKKAGVILQTCVFAFRTCFI
jgi:hypothetical protein